MRTWSFAKGHGTKNDFIIIKDRHAMINLSPEDIRCLCDRHGGVGADGVLRVVKAGHISTWSGPGNLWFMDYRNADGSIAEMCGNGLRVFVRYLLDEGLIAGDRVRVATRAGEHQAQIERDGQITVTMGQAQVTDAPTTVTVDRQQFTATKIDMPNPHAVVWLEDFDQLDRLNLFVPPVVDQDVFPSGANVEFVVAEQKNRSRMRVWERGVGETMSCGTGAVAVAVDALNRAGLEVGTWRVDVPGGIVRVHRKEGGHLFLTGPAVIVARGDILVPEH